MGEGEIKKTKKCMNIFSPKGFLQIGSILLIFLGILGFVGVLGPVAGSSIFGTFWWFDHLESTSFVLTGALSLIIVFLFPPMFQRYFAMLLGIISVVIGVYNFMGNNTRLYTANLESPSDLLFFLLFGAWALYAVFGNVRKKVV
ncbi:MAG: hypothetical protein ACM3IJ_01485 [Candidatus Levyibacteriota bacterium]